MNTKIFLVEFEIESHGALAADLPSVRCVNPIDSVQIEIINFRVAPGTDVPLLHARLTLEADDQESAIESATFRLGEFLHHLCFVTSMRFRIHRLSKILDGVPGKKMRDCYVYSPIYGHADLPYVLEGGLFESVEFLQRTEMSSAFRRALKWYSNGIAASEVEDQFQYFWLAIEVLSTLDRSRDQVADECSVCRGQLFCKACNKVTTHRPYPRQHIEALFSRYIKGNNAGELFKDATQVRHALAHGEDLDEIEKKGGVGARHVVDAIGGLAWTVLFHRFQTTPKKPLDNGATTFRLTLLQPSTFIHQLDQMAVHLTIESRDPEHPSLADIPTVEMTREFVPTKQPP